MSSRYVFHYGDHRHFTTLTSVPIDVLAGGRRIADELGITRCLARRHGCELQVPTAI